VEVVERFVGDVLAARRELDDVLQDLPLVGADIDAVGVLGEGEGEQQAQMLRVPEPLLASGTTSALARRSCESSPRRVAP
jgi:hypothetical protein